MSQPQHIILKLDVSKIVKEWLFKGQKGTYLDLVVYENDATDQYGNSHVVKQSPSKDLRDQGTKPIIIGNGKWMNAGGRQPAQPSRGQPATRQAHAGQPQGRRAPSGTIQYAPPQPDTGDDQIPF